MIIENLEIFDSIWFDIKVPGPFKAIGVVCVNDTISKQIKMYIGPVCGYDQLKDIIMVIRTGVPFKSKDVIKWLSKYSKKEQKV